MKLCQLSLLLLCLVPAVAAAECKEYKIVEYEDRVEAVCVGEPPTEAEKKAFQDEEKRQEIENRKLRAQDDRLRKQAERAAVAKENNRIMSEEEKMKQVVRPIGTTPPFDRGKINPFRQ